MTRYDTDRVKGSDPLSGCDLRGLTPSSVERRLPAFEHRGLPVRADDPRVLDPRAQLRLRKLAVLVLQPDAVRVARLEVCDQHLARDFALAAGRDVEVDLEEGVQVAVEHRRHALLLEQLDVLEPVDVLTGRGGLEVDALDRRDVLLVREALPRQVLGVDRDDLLGLAGALPRIQASSCLARHGLPLVDLLAHVLGGVHALLGGRLAHRAPSPPVPALSGTAGSSSTGFAT